MRNPQGCPTKPVFTPVSLKVAWSGKSLIKNVFKLNPLRLELQKKLTVTDLCPDGGGDLGVQDLSQLPSAHTHTNVVGRLHNDWRQLVPHSRL